MVNRKAPTVEHTEPWGGLATVVEDYITFHFQPRTGFWGYRENSSEDKNKTSFLTVTAPDCCFWLTKLCCSTRMFIYFSAHRDCRRWFELRPCSLTKSGYLLLITIALIFTLCFLSFIPFSVSSRRSLCLSHLHYRTMKLFSLHFPALGSGQRVCHYMALLEQRGFRALFRSLTIIV